MRSVARQRPSSYVVSLPARVIASGQPFPSLVARFSSRYGELTTRTLTIALIVAASLRLIHFLTLIDDWTLGVSIGVDRGIYVSAANRWMAGGSFYLPHQLAGPYPIQWIGEVLYPPVGLYLFVPFAFLPAILWWCVPIGLVVAGVWRLRPSGWVLPLMAFLLLWPRTQELVLWGNPAMFILAAETWGLILGWPAVLILIKPTLAPFVLVGANRRSFWLVLACALAAALPFGALWFDWLRVITNVTNADWTYSLNEVPTLLIPILAWLGATRGGRRGVRRASQLATATTSIRSTAVAPSS